MYIKQIGSSKEFRELLVCYIRKCSVTENKSLFNNKLTVVFVSYNINIQSAVVFTHF
jgi:hypothetical protein